jgi:hypothetical protein
MADTGSFFIGHGYKAWDYSLNDDSDDGGDVMDIERRKDLAIEMGLTENMFSSVTNIFGLTGLVLYAVFLLNLGLQLWKGMLLSPERSSSRALCEFSLVNLVAALTSCCFQGTVPNIMLIFWMLGVLAARPYLATKKAAAPSVKDRPAFARPALEGQSTLAPPHRFGPRPV